MIFTATWQRCRVHFMRNALAHAGKSGRRVVSAFIGTAFAQNPMIHGGPKRQASPPRSPDRVSFGDRMKGLLAFHGAASPTSCAPNCRSSPD